MPKMVTIEVNPSFSAKDAAGKAAFEAAKSKGAISVSWVSAQEAVKNSNGLYRVKPEGPAPLPAAPSLQTLANDELKRMYLSMGGKVSGKQIKRSEMITFITAQLDAIEVVGDEEIPSDGGVQTGD